MENGYIPNAYAGRTVIMDVFVSTNKYDSVIGAENALQIGSQNPNGAGASPQYRVEFKIDSVQYDYRGV